MLFSNVDTDKDMLRVHYTQYNVVNITRAVIGRWPWSIIHCSTHGWRHGKRLTVASDVKYHVSLRASTLFRGAARSHARAAGQRRREWEKRGKIIVKFSMCSCERAGWLGSLDLGFSNRDVGKRAENFSIWTLQPGYRDEWMNEFWRSGLHRLAFACCIFHIRSIPFNCSDTALRVAKAMIGTKVMIFVFRHVCSSVARIFGLFSYRKPGWNFSYEPRAKLVPVTGPFRSVGLIWRGLQFSWGAFLLPGWFGSGSVIWDYLAGSWYIKETDESFPDWIRRFLWWSEWSRIIDPDPDPIPMKCTIS